MNVKIAQELGKMAAMKDGGLVKVAIPTGLGSRMGGVFDDAMAAGKDVLSPLMSSIGAGAKKAKGGLDDLGESFFPRPGPQLTEDMLSARKSDAWGALKAGLGDMAPGVAVGGAGLGTAGLAGYGGAKALGVGERDQPSYMPYLPPMMRG